MTDEEMLRTFNLSVGLAMVVKPDAADKIMEQIKNQGVNCYAIGVITPGDQTVKTINTLNW